MSGFADLADKFSKMKRRVKPKAEKALHDSMVDASRQMQVELIRSDAIATHDLRRSIQADFTMPSKGHFTSMKITAAPWWKYVEFGTGIYTSRAYPAASPWPPIGPILEWVVAKGITPDPDDGPDSQLQLAFAIQRSLSSGTPAQRFVRPAWRGPRGKEHVVRSVSNAITDAITGEL